MTKEELEKEAIKASDKKCVKGCSKYYRYGFQDGYLAGAEPREKRIAELEKENAKLRKDKKELCHSISEGGKACVYLNDQLTKAKQIIQEFLDLNYSEFTKTNAVFLHADKFLKES